jgi:hypothetical protein
MELSGSEQGPARAFCEHSNNPSCVIKGEKFRLQLSHNQILEKVSSVWSFVKQSF